MHQVEVSVLEIYNNEIRDLLSPNSPPPPFRTSSLSPRSPASLRRLRAPAPTRGRVGNGRGGPVGMGMGTRPKLPHLPRYDVMMATDGSMCVSSLTSL